MLEPKNVKKALGVLKGQRVWLRDKLPGWLASLDALQDLDAMGLVEFEVRRVPDDGRNPFLDVILGWFSLRDKKLYPFAQEAVERAAQNHHQTFVRLTDTGWEKAGEVPFKNPEKRERGRPKGAFKDAKSTKTIGEHWKTNGPQLKTYEAAARALSGRKTFENVTQIDYRLACDRYRKQQRATELAVKTHE